LTGARAPVIISTMENLESYANERFALNRQKQTLKQQQQQRLSVTYNGGLFRVDMTLLNYLYMKNINVGLFNKPVETIIPDSYDTPIEVNVQELLELCDERWNEIHNDWHNEFQLLKGKRKAGQVEV